MHAAELMEGADIHIAAILDFRNRILMCTECRRTVDLDTAGSYLAERKGPVKG